MPPGDGQSTELLRAAGEAEHAVLMSLGHGLGAPRKGWGSADEQRARQGTLFLGVDELGADALRTAPFLPGGAWLSVACFSAGTPATSAFHPWLAANGGVKGMPDVLRSLPKSGERPFVAAAPQAALANPRGPLAVIGHIDLAWTFGFSDPETQDSRASRMFSVLRTLLAGGRAGVALDALMRTYRDTNDDLMARYHRQREAAARGEPDPEDPLALGRLWLQRNDLRGYVLLGDPAARLGVRRRAAPAKRERQPAPLAGPPERPPAPIAAPPAPERPTRTPSTPPVERKAPARTDDAGDPPDDAPERAVLALLHGDEAPRAIASRFGITVAELFRWLDRYRHAGRRGLPG